MGSGLLRVNYPHGVVLLAEWLLCQCGAHQKFANLKKNQFWAACGGFFNDTKGSRGSGGVFLSRWTWGLILLPHLGLCESPCRDCMRHVGSALFFFFQENRGVVFSSTMSGCCTECLSVPQDQWVKNTLHKMSLYLLSLPKQYVKYSGYWSS